MRLVSKTGVSPVAPFNFDATFHKPAHFPSGDNFWELGKLKTVTEKELRALKVGYRAKFIKKIDEQFAGGLIGEFDLRKKD